MSNPERRRLPSTLLLTLGTLIVLILQYVPLVRVHQSWEDEVYWFSTCLSMIRHLPPIPSVLADFPGTQSPLRFYGPVLFWMGAGVLKVFGATAVSWRSFTFAGTVVFLLAIVLLLRRLGRPWLLCAAGAFVFSLSLGSSFALSLPGRPDAWGTAVLVAAMAVVAYREDATFPAGLTGIGRSLLLGLLLGLAATTSPRTWPLIFCMVVLLPLVKAFRTVRALAATVAAMLASMTVILLPLRISPWGFLAYVRAASNNDARDISPLMGGSWGFGHSTSQVVYFATILAILCLLSISRWGEISDFRRWLLVSGLLNLLLTLLLLSRALNMSVYWGFPLEISALLALTLPAPQRRRQAAGILALLLVLFLALLRTARELPVLIHWHQRNPATVARAEGAAIPSGSLVYGPLGQYFYATLANGSEYRYLQDWTTPGRSSVPGVVNTPAPMTDACTRPAYLIWYKSGGVTELPPLPHAFAVPLAEYHAEPQRISKLEQIIESVPGGRSEWEDTSFSLYRLQMNALYCDAKVREQPPS